MLCSPRSITYFRGDVTKPDTLDVFFSGLEDSEVIVLHMAAIISIQDNITSSARFIILNSIKLSGHSRKVRT